MSETGFKCPKCGNAEHFTASAVLLTTEVRIDESGWDYWSEPAHAELPDFAFMHCEECGFSTHATEFSKACADEWWRKEKEE